MRKSYVLLLILVFVNCSYSQSGWVWQNPYPQGEYLRKIFMVNSYTGYVIGGNRFDRDGAAFLKTTNGGENWTNINSFKNTVLISVYFANCDTGWVCGYSAIAEDTVYGLVFQTVNGGISWSVQLKTKDALFTGLSFVNPENGWIFGYRYNLLELKNKQDFDMSPFVMKTTNGGTNWDKIKVDFTGRLYCDICFVNTGTGFLYGTGIMKDKKKREEQYKALILKTTNGGNIFKVVGDTFSGGIKGMTFVNPNTGWCLKYDIYGNCIEVQKTTSGGSKWFPQLRSEDSGFYSSVYFLDDKTGWITGRKGAADNIIDAQPLLFLTTDGGIKWIDKSGKIEIDLGKNAFREVVSTRFLNAATGWVLVDCEILKTTNMGESWGIQSIGAKDEFRFIKFFDTDTGMIFAKEGLSFLTTDKGENWFIGSSRSNYHFYSVSFINTMMGWASNWKPRELALLKTTSGGSTWENVYSDTTSFFKHMQLLDETTGWVLTSSVKRGVYDEILRLNFNGEINLKFSFDKNVRLEEFYFADAFTGWTCGMTEQRHGIVLKTTDGGSSWNVKWTGEQDTVKLRSMFFLNSQTGWITGGHYDSDYLKTGNVVIIRTTDGGENWEVQFGNNMESSFVSIYFLNENTGWASGREIFGTTDGGKTWNFLSKVKGYVRDSYFINPNTGWLIGTKGMILKTTTGGREY
jgi:photosystem II stability/assembly factor-like uncharacterized protein